MNRMKTVLKFELGNYFGSKSFIIPTIIICILCAGLMFFPRIKESFTADSSNGDQEISESAEKFAIYDPNAFMSLTSDDEFKAIMQGEMVRCNSVDEVKKLVENEEVKAGFSITSFVSFDYYIFNKSLDDSYSSMFQEYLSQLEKYNYCQKNNLDTNEFFALEYTPIEVNENVLGKDSTENYWYCYVLVIVVFMMIIMYGVSIATGVASEKGNRSIEILVTSTSTNALLFGKVFAGLIASVFQTGLVALSLFGSYQFNKDYFDGTIATMLDIPGEVLATFALFGIGGLLLYSFLYGALGALVSKVEDLNKTAGTAQMLIMIVYFVVLFQLHNIDGPVMKICSFIPFSSYSAMFARVAMGNVAPWEIVVSAVILYASVIGMGFVGGKIFRNSTLRYGNPIKLTAALKNLREK